MPRLFGGARHKGKLSDMNTITIPDPTEVLLKLQNALPDAAKVDTPRFGPYGWHCVYWPTVSECIIGNGDTPEELLNDLQIKLSALDPLAKLRKQAMAHGYALMKLPD
jgi:hypothetical protein